MFLSEQLVALIMAAQGESPHCSLWMQLQRFFSYFEKCATRGAQVISDALPRSDAMAASLRGEGVTDVQVHMVERCIVDAIAKWKERVVPMLALLETRYCLDPASPRKGELPRDVICFVITPKMLVEYEAFTSQAQSSTPDSTGSVVPRSSRRWLSTPVAFSASRYHPCLLRKRSAR